MLLAASARMLADIEVQNGNIDEAIRIIRIAIKKTSLANQKNSLILDEAALLISNGNVDNARQKIQMVLEVENLPSSQKQDADILLGKLTS
jgi:Flp pilus assembly protein TadD